MDRCAGNLYTSLNENNTFEGLQFAVFDQIAKNVDT